VFPCRPGEKTPLCTNGHKVATTDPAIIKGWWAESPNANIGLVMGPNGLIAIDVDPRSGGTETLAKLEKELGPLPRNSCQRTQSGGFHILFKHPGVALKGKLPGGIDIKDNGYILVAPSMVQRADGSIGHYAWEAFTVEGPLPPKWLAYIAKATDPDPSQSAVRTSDGEEQWAQSVPPRSLTDEESQQLTKDLAALPKRGQGKNATFQAIAAIFHGCGRSTDEGMPFLRVWNAQCGKPHPQSELLRQIERIRDGDALEGERGDSLKLSLLNLTIGAQGRPTSHSFDDVGNSRRLVEYLKGRFKYVADRNRWFCWNGKHWQSDVSNLIQEQAKSMTDILREELKELERKLELTADDDEKKKLVNLIGAQKTQVKALRSQHGIRSMIALSQSDDRVRAKASDFDANHMLLTCATGTIDLTTGTLRAHSPSDMLTKASEVAFDVDAQCSRFDKFMTELFPDEDERHWLRRYVGYCLTGDIREHLAVFLYGTGANGKSTFIAVLQQLLGDYSHGVSSELFVIGKNEDAARRQRMGLRGLRLAICNELPNAGRLNETTFKQLTGDDKINGAELYCADTEFEPTHKMLIASNHKPNVKSQDHGTWRRIAIIPFGRRFTDQQKDSQLRNKLNAELPGILNWAVQGCLDWQRVGLKPLPPQFATATSEYQNAEDPLADFLTGYETEVDYTVPVADLYKAYKTWFTGPIHSRWVLKTFCKNMESRGYKTKRVGKANVTMFLGLRANPSAVSVERTPLKLVE
jgi:putative DNA primase/helicase